MFSWLRHKRTPIIVAHRGSSARAPENTIAAFRQAVHDGADAVELDVRLTKEGKLVVFHDSRLNRTTNGRGLVRTRSLSELRRFDAGSWFNRKFASERIPTLDEILERLPVQVGVNIEMKIDRRDGRGEELVRCLSEIIKHENARQRLLVSSFHHALVRQLKAVEPKIATGLLVHPLQRLGRLALRKARGLNTEMIILSGTSLRKRVIEPAHRHELMVGEYTVNTGRRLERALRLGVDVIFTDDPASILQLLHPAK